MGRLKSATHPHGTDNRRAGDDPNRESVGRSRALYLDLVGSLGDRNVADYVASQSSLVTACAEWRKRHEILAAAVYGKMA